MPIWFRSNCVLHNKYLLGYIIHTSKMLMGSVLFWSRICEVLILWEGHTIWKNISHFFFLNYLVTSKKWDFNKLWPSQNDWTLHVTNIFSTFNPSFTNLLKLSKNKKGQKNFYLHQKCCPFFTAGSWKKHHFWCSLKIFRPILFCEGFKGQLISKRFFEVVDFLQKTNENKSTWGIIVVKSNSFVRFLEEIDDPKNHFEINWPLER